MQGEPAVDEVGRAQAGATATVNCPVPAPNSTTGDSRVRPKSFRRATSFEAPASIFAS